MIKKNMKKTKIYKKWNKNINLTIKKKNHQKTGKKFVLNCLTEKFYRVNIFEKFFLKTFYLKKYLQNFLHDFLPK